MSIEAMKLALEALEQMYCCYANPKFISHKQQEVQIIEQTKDAMASLRQAIKESSDSVLREQAQKSNEIDVLRIAMDSIDHHAKELWKCRARIQQLEQAQQSEARGLSQQKQEPEGNAYDDQRRSMEQAFAQKQEPDDLHIAYMSGLNRGKELAQHPAAEGEDIKKPLTDEQKRLVICNAMQTVTKGSNTFSITANDVWFAIIEAIEAAHGITGEQK